jgi:hypothetical protein
VVGRIVAAVTSLGDAGHGQRSDGGERQQSLGRVREIAFSGWWIRRLAGAQAILSRDVPLAMGYRSY